MLRTGDKKKQFWRVTKPQTGGGRTVKTYSNRVAAETAFDFAYTQIANRGVKSFVLNKLQAVEAAKNPVPRYLIPKKAIAQRYSVSPRTIEFWVTKRRIPCVKVGRQSLFNVADCDHAVDRFKRAV
jgi:hypothetical protein